MNIIQNISKWLPKKQQKVITNNKSKQNTNNGTTCQT
jgi:hypothetical protein